MHPACLQSGSASSHIHTPSPICGLEEEDELALVPWSRGVCPLPSRVEGPVLSLTPGPVICAVCGEQPGAKVT